MNFKSKSTVCHKYSLERIEICPNGPECGPKWARNGPEMDPKWARIDPRPEGPRRAAENLKTGQKR